MEKILQYTPPVYSGTEKTLETANGYRTDSEFQVIEPSYYLNEPLKSQTILEQDIEFLCQEILETKRPKGFFSKLKSWW